MEPRGLLEGARRGDDILLVDLGRGELEPVEPDHGLAVVAVRPEGVIGQSAIQEFYAGQAEDHFVVLLTDTKVTVPLGSFSGALLTAEWTPLEPDVLSEKFYVKGTSEVREVDVAGGDEKLELMKIVRP